MSIEGGDITMTRRGRFSGVGHSKPAPKQSDDIFWKDFNRRIEDGRVIPIISNSVRNDRIFDINYNYDIEAGSQETEESEESELNTNNLNISEELSIEWAYQIGYPMSDKHELARVAVYNGVNSDDAELAKNKYLDFLKTFLLKLAEKDPDVAELDVNLRALQRQSTTLTFSEIATMLNYPKFDETQEDSLELLARLNLPIYITTSYYDFMERALATPGRTPHTQICFYSEEPRGLAKEHRFDPDFVPTKTNPVVYHLHGLSSTLKPWF
jgi:hypothetical protein